MATKTEKRKKEKFKQETKESEERMKNLSQNDIVQLENYALFQVLYINDVACNECKFLAEKLKTIPYKSKAVQKIYNALMKRVNAYWEMIGQTTIDLNSLSNLFSNMDEYIDKPVAKLNKAIYDVLTEYGVVDADWVASVETVYSVCNFAAGVADGLIKRTGKYSKNVLHLKCLIIQEITNVARSLTKTVTEIHVPKDVDIDLNKEQSTLSAYNQLYKLFMNPDLFIKAAISADEQNAKEGTMNLIYNKKQEV